MVARLPSRSRLRELLTYDEETGKLYWKPRPDARSSWNTRYAGKEAFTAMHNAGYKVGSIDDKMYLAHRVIWKMVTGEDPDDIDHIDGDRTQNQISNLRSVTRAENLRNKKLEPSNTSGVMGVSWEPALEKWGAYINVDNKRHRLGYYKEFDEAVMARQASEIEFGFHENHGRPA